MIIIKNKRGVSMFVVGLIVLMAGFLITLLLISRLNLGGITDAEICHNSVFRSGQTPIPLGSLDCKTQYVCISGGEDCEEITASGKIEVDSDSKEEIMKALADKMASCWWQFGEDKELNYAGSPELSGGVDCAICSIIEFDPKIQEKLLKITYSEFYGYLEKTKKDSSQSYLKYLYGVSDVDNLIIQEQFKIVDIKNDFFSTRDKYSIITGIDSTESMSGLIREWLNVYIVPTIETPATSCTEFITKA